ncbi:hypothetical protein ACH4VM_18750 [Streptomyces sp. NPDC020792]|uniref:hypothetical protein n=1 Tax=Streptomyces sp. NPDC020792 TaxID=3365089 RepID=UPI0037B2FFD2
MTGFGSRSYVVMSASGRGSGGGRRACREVVLAPCRTVAHLLEGGVAPAGRDGHQVDADRVEAENSLHAADDRRSRQLPVGDSSTSISTRVPSCPPALVFAAEQNAS